MILNNKQIEEAYRKSDIIFITETEGMALSEMLTTLRSLSENVGALTRDLKTLQWVMPFVVTVGILVIGVIVYLK